MKTELEKKLIKARTNMILTQPFFASVVMSLPLIEDKSIPAPMATDGTKILYNPDYLNKCSLEDLKFIFAHEAMHVTNLHHLRQGNRKKLTQTKDGRVFTLWNVATDYSINYLIEQTGLPVPKNALKSDEYGKNSAEKNYELLLNEMEKNKKNNKNKNSGNGKDEFEKFPDFIGGDVFSPKDENGNELSEGAKKIMELKTKDIIKNAADAAKRQGRLPASIERYVKELFEVKINWKEALSQFVNRYSRNDYTWQKRNKRYSEFYLPSLKSPEVGNLVVAIDTSGSLSPKDLSEISSEITGILVTYNGGIELTIIYCDCQVNQIEQYNCYDALKLKMVGGGGTDYIPVFEKAKELDEEPVALIYFTDGYCSSFPEKEPDYPVLWVLTEKNEYFKNPFGTKIHIRTELKGV